MAGADPRIHIMTVGEEDFREIDALNQSGSPVTKGTITMSQTAVRISS